MRVGLAAHEDEVLQSVGEAIVVVGLSGCRVGSGRLHTPGQRRTHAQEKSL